MYKKMQIIHVTKITVERFISDGVLYFRHYNLSVKKEN